MHVDHSFPMEHVELEDHEEEISSTLNISNLLSCNLLMIIILLFEHISLSLTDQSLPFPHIVIE